MEFEIETSRFKTLSRIIRDTISDSTVTVWEDGMVINQINKSSIRGLHMQTGTDIFESWEADEQLEFGVSWSKVYDMVSKINDETFTVRYESESRKWIFSADSGFEYKMSLVATSGIPDGEPPEIDYDVSTECTVDDITRGIGMCEFVDDKIHFEVKDNKLFAWTSGDTDDVEVPIVEVDNDTKEVHTRFGVSTLDDALGGFAGDQSSTLNFHYNGGRGEGKNYPMELQTDLYGADLRLMFAPQNKGQV